jgi:hypothetical protein
VPGPRVAVDIATGAVLRGPATKALGTYGGHEEDGKLQVGI